VEGGLDARVIPEADAFRREVVIKGAWNAVVGLPLAVHETTLGGYLDDRPDECRAVVEETVGAASAELGVTVGSAEVLDRLLATTRTLRDVGGSTTALVWRAGAVARMGRRHRIPTPVTDRLLLAAGYDPGPPSAGLPERPRPPER
jgi:ketopantoate reductase